MQDAWLHDVDGLDDRSLGGRLPMFQIAPLPVVTWEFKVRNAHRSDARLIVEHPLTITLICDQQPRINACRRQFPCE